jgi:hypothetical protein
MDRIGPCALLCEGLVFPISRSRVIYPESRIDCAVRRHIRILNFHVDGGQTPSRRRSGLIDFHYMRRGMALLWSPPCFNSRRRAGRSGHQASLSARSTPWQFGLRKALLIEASVPECGWFADANKKFVRDSPQLLNYVGQLPEIGRTVR